jgi:hypothetical protein
VAIDPEPVPKELARLRESIAYAERYVARAAHRVAFALEEQERAADGLELAKARERAWLEANPRRQLELL